MLSEDAIREELAGARRGIARAKKNGNEILAASYGGFELALLYVLEEPAK
jgi:hypothetical protein